MSFLHLHRPTPRYFSRDQLKEAREVYEDYGPTARLCISFVKCPDQLDFYKQRHELENSKFSLRYVLKVAGHGDFRLDVSHSIFLIRRENADNLQYFSLNPLLIRQATAKDTNAKRGVHPTKPSLPMPVNGPADSATRWDRFESMAQLQL